jgi:hypothetical protein
VAPHPWGSLPSSPEKERKEKKEKKGEEEEDPSFSLSPYLERVARAVSPRSPPMRGARKREPPSRFNPRPSKKDKK